MEFANPLVFLLISPVLLAGWYAVRKGVPRLIMISRIVILSLLIAALASPFTMGVSTVKDEAPRITVLSDQTMSMDLFSKDTGQKIFEALKSKTPTTYRQFTGMNSPIGDEVMQSAENNNIVLVSDGNSNHGKDLSDAISIASKTGTRVFAVKQKPAHNDMSVEIVSPKNLIIGNENVFNIVVRQAGNSARYRLDVEIDKKPVNLAEGNRVQTERTRTIPVSVAFTALGKHEIKATITPASEDWFKTNNVFYKAVYVVPKPSILAVTDDTGSSLYKSIDALYNVTAANSVPDDLTPYKAVVIDNKDAAQLNAGVLSTYVGGGGGLVVVGGDASYDRGNYNNSPVEAILPIISRSAEFRGGRAIIIIIDASTSTVGGFIDYIDANAINIIQKMPSDSQVGVVAFGGTKTIQTDVLSMGSEANKATLKKFIEEIGGPQQRGELTTDLDKGLLTADDLLKSVSGTKEIIVLSDGLMPQKGQGFEPIKKAVEDLTNEGIKIHFVQVLTSHEEFNPETGTKMPNSRYEELAQVEGKDQHVLVLNPEERASTLLGEESGTTPTPTATPEISYEYPLAMVDSDHFITKYINLSASVTGYNDVTPKLGADRLVATTKGKPILTTWGFGLGRVAAFTTDDGGGMTMWASAMYSGENSRLISSMVNWAIGDPRPSEGVVIQAEDIWGGDPGRVVITSDTLPQIKLDGTPLELSRTGPTTYETSISPQKEGFHDLSGYEVAVNYPLEYRDVGFNEKLSDAIESGGGRVYDENEVEGLLLMDIKEKAVRTVEEPQSEKEPFLLAALALFLLEVIIRRLKDYRKDRPQIQDNPPRVTEETAAAE